MIKQDPRIETSEVLSLFPTFVWKVQLTSGFHEQVNSKILAALGNLNPHLTDMTPGEAWQSDQQLHQLEEFGELMSCIQSTTSTVLHFLKVGYDALEVTGCWATVNAPGTAHAQHSHPNNFLSGVYYVQTQAGAETINFHDPRAQTGIIRPPVTELTAQNTDQVVVKVQNGTLLVFPSYLPHSVAPNESGGLRISISFNVMFSSFAEKLGKPLWEPATTASSRRRP